MSNVGNDGVVLHLGHVGSHDNVFVSGSGDENIASLKDVLFPDDWDFFHARLKGADRVDFRDADSSTGGFESKSASLTNITVTKDQCLLSGDSKHKND